MDNPIQVLLSRAYLTPRAFAVLNDLSPDTVRGSLNGKCRRPPEKIKEALKKMGVDVSELDVQYAAWLKWRADEDIRTLRRKP